MSTSSMNKRNVYKSNSYDNGEVGHNGNGHSNNALGGYGLNRSSSINSIPPPPPPLSSPTPNKRSLSSSSSHLPRPSIGSIQRSGSISNVTSSTTTRRKIYKNPDINTYIDHENPPMSPNPHGQGQGQGQMGANANRWVQTQNPNARQKSKGGRSRCRLLMSCFVYLMTFVLVAGCVVYAYQERVTMKDQLTEHETMMHEQEIELSMKFDSKIKRLQEENAKLQHKVTDEKELKIINQQLKDEKSRLETHVKEQKDVHQDSGTQSQRRVEQLEQQLEILDKSKAELKEYKNQMHQSIQLMSKNALLEKFGPGPHRVEIMVGFDSHQGREDRGIITIEMAPVEDMPHSVYWFLEQVTRKLYDGNSFHRNPGHVMQAGPAPNFLSPPGNQHLNKRFKDAGFHSVLFQEYSDKFPHKKFTVGYAGRPGGPDFYVSMKDNSKNHGPGGQVGDPTEADPCFAKVIDGFDVVERMSKTPVQEGSYHSMKDNVAIVSMKIKMQ